MKLLLFFASLLIIAIPHAHARILQGDKLDIMILSVFERPKPGPPPPPSPSESDRHSTIGNSSPCDHDTINNYSNNKIKCQRSDHAIIWSPPAAVEAKPRSPPPPPKGSDPIGPLRTKTPPALDLCMPGRPCSIRTDDFIM